MQKDDDVRRLLSVLREYTTFGHWFPADLARITVRTLEGLLEERDAAISELVGTCQVCRWEETAKCSSCHFCEDAWNVHDSNWEWKGVQKEG